MEETKAVRKGEEIDIDSLRTYLKGQPNLPDGEIDVAQFPAGSSNLTYLIRLGQEEFVLRRPPFGNTVKSAHDMQREFDVLSKLSAVYAPAPKPLLFCRDESVIGSEFYLMERRHGLIIRGKIPGTTAEIVKQDRCRSPHVSKGDRLSRDPTDHRNRSKRSRLTTRTVCPVLHPKPRRSPLPRFQRRRPRDPRQTRRLQPTPGRRLDKTLLRCKDRRTRRTRKSDHLAQRQHPNRIRRVADPQRLQIRQHHARPVRPDKDHRCPRLGNGHHRRPADGPRHDARLLDVQGRSRWLLDMPFNPRVLMENISRQRTRRNVRQNPGTRCSRHAFLLRFRHVQDRRDRQQIYARFVRGFTKDARFANFDKFVAALGRIAIRYSHCE